MVYRKFIKKGGKVYGPYLYHSRRVGGKVVSEYHGPTKNSNYKFLWIFLGIFILIIFIFGLVFSNRGMSGMAILDLSANYQEGDTMDNLKLSLNEGELIPASSKIIFEYSENTYEYLLSDLTDAEITEGNFYIEGRDISGTGEGYGKEGVNEISPMVYFTLEIYSESEDESAENESLIVEDSEDESIEEQVIDGENFSGDENESESSGINPILAIANLFGKIGITGGMIMELDDEVYGKVSANSSFVYDLNEGQTAELKLGSVKTETKNLPNDAVNLKSEGNQIVVTTDYTEKKKGFGEGYLGNSEKDLVLDLSGLDLTFEKDLKINLVYDDRDITSAEFEPENKIEEETENVEEIKVAEEKETEINESEETEVEKIPTEIFELSLTEEERKVLIEEFGNVSLKKTSSKIFNGRLIVRYEFGDAEIEYSYDYSQDEKILEAQIQKDKIKFLKDLAQNLLSEENVPEPVEIAEDEYII